MNQNDDRNSPEAEYVAADDRVIGRALRISGFILLSVIIVGLGLVWYLNRGDDAVEEQRTEIDVPVQRLESRDAVPRVAFEDVAQSAGIGYVHNNGATGEKLLPESLGGGVALFDFDNDGDLDLLFVNSTWWPWDMEKNPELKGTTAALHRNDTDPDGGGIRFTDVTAGSGLDTPVYGMGVAIGDVDNDGDRDVFLTCVGPNRLFLNDGSGHFTDVSTVAGIEGGSGDWSTAAAFLDFDEDGYLDLFVGNYVRWSREIDYQVNFTIDGVQRAYGPPTDFEGAFSRLYRNLGNGHFEDVSESSGVQVRNRATGKPSAKALGVCVHDFNRDGLVDFMVANDTVQNLLFINQGDGTFRESGVLSGVAFDSNGNTRGAMGIDVAAYRNDDEVGIAIGNFANEMTSLYVTQGAPMLFADEAIAEGIGPTSRLSLKFGIFFWDYDLDGWLDLLSVNGHLDEDIVKVQQSQTYRQSALLYWNNKGRGFVHVDGENSPGDLFEPIVGRGCAYGDLDSDGDLDVVMTQLHGRPMVLRNDQQTGHSWLRLKLEGPADSNPDAIGALVEVKGGGMTQTRFVTPTRGYLSQSETVLTFGLGKVGEIESIRVEWPDGTVQEIDPATQGMDRNRQYTILHPSR